MTDIVDLGEKRAERFLEEVEEGKYPAFTAGYEPAEKLAAWYLAGGYTPDDMIHAMAYSAAAEVFRNELEPGAAERVVRETFESIIRDLLAHGPHYGHEAY